MSESMTGGAALARQLRAQGVEVIFGLPGDQLMSALDALVDVPEIRYLVTRHEQATTYMADGYARAGGRPGVAMVVPGVGVYNAASGLATAYACSSPVLLIAGQVNRDGIGREKFGGRELGTALANPDWVMLAHAFGAEGMIVDDVGKLPAAMENAIEATTGTSGTSTVIAVPMDRLPSPF